MKIAGKVILKRGKEYSIERKHPWIFSGAIQNTSGDLTDGCWVEVFSSGNKRLGAGHYQEGSIVVRLLTFGNDLPQENFWRERLASALALRSGAALPSGLTNSFRLIHGEGDNLSGLIIDYYDGAAIIQTHSHGMHEDRQAIADALHNVFGAQLRLTYYKRATQQGKARIEASQEYLFGMGGVPHIILENGNRFYVDWEEGQKTGFFLDQRDNRKLLGDYSAGRNVLNTFCYTGGFSIYAINGNAQLVHSVDVSDKAIDLTKKNLELNQFDQHHHQCYAEDTFDFMKDKHDCYDLIVLDPPAFAKHRDARHQAVKGYQRLNTEAMKIIRPGGVIFTFSCSQVVDRKLFYDTVVSSAIQAGRNIKVLHHLAQPADHPVNIYHPEGEYLKGLVLYVE